MNFSKIDLHLHLDGSINPELAYKVSKEQNIIDINLNFKEFESMLHADNVYNLKEYLDRFEIPIKLLKNKDNLYLFTYDLIKRLEEQNIKYVEIRLAPQFIESDGISQEEAFKECLKARKQAINDNLDIEVNFILCMMVLGDTNNNHRQNIETIELTKKYLNKGVCLLDLAGAETSAPMIDFKPYFELASSYNIPFTIHAGEQGGFENVDIAIDFGAVRIGHGIASINNKQVIEKLISKNIALEVCITSNIQTKNQPSYQQHCLKDLYKLGVLTTINTDNMTVSNINLNDEYNHILNQQKLTKKDILKMMINSVNVSYASTNLKSNLIKEYQTLLDEIS
jgi:adenosine deaminase